MSKEQRYERFNVNLWFLSLSRGYHQAGPEEAEVTSVELEKRWHGLREAKSKRCILYGNQTKLHRFHLMTRLKRLYDCESSGSSLREHIDAGGPIFLVL